MSFLDSLIRLFAENGYLAVFLALLVSGFGIPVPEDITLVAGGVIAGLGYADVHWMTAVGLAGVMFGDTAMFVIGHLAGPRALKIGWVARILTPKRYAQVLRMFDRYGNRLMFVARFLPGLRTAVFLTAGMTRRVAFWRFFCFDGLAAVLSVPFWVWLGYLGAENREWLIGWVKKSENLILLAVALLAAAVVAFFWMRGRKRHLRLRAHRVRRASRLLGPRG